MLHNRVKENSDVKSGTDNPAAPVAGSRKQPSAETQDRRMMPSRLDSGDIEATLQNRVLSSSHVGRAALFDKDDVAQVAGTNARFDISQEQTRELLDALLAVHREVEGTNNTVTGQAPKSIDLEGSSYSIADKTTDQVTLTSGGKAPLVLVSSAKTFLIIEGAENASVESLKVIAASWAEGLQSMGM